MYNTIFFIIIGILVFEFLLERLLDYLNSTKRSTVLPKELEGIYDSEKYKQQQQYEKANSTFSGISSTFNLLIFLLMFFLGGFSYVNKIALGVSDHPIITALVFFGILIIGNEIINIPFALYDTFVIEERFGFNKTTPKTFVLDKIRLWILAAVIGGGLLSLIILFYQKATENFWIYAWIVISAFLIFLTIFYSTLIVPLFNKQTPLEEGQLRNEIKSFCEKAGFKLDNVFVIDGSQRSTKANAYFSGLGRRKRIVLFDTLINDLKIQEVVAVLAHEIGHFIKKHVRQYIVLSIIQTGLLLYIFSLFVDSPELSKALGVETPSFHIGLISFGILYSPISTILGLLMNMLSRKNEYEADRFAKEHYDVNALASSLKKLSVKNLSNLTPHPAYVFFHYSHPPLLQRLKALGETVNNNE